MNAIGPSIVCQSRDVRDGFQNGAITLETGAQAEHPHLVTGLDPPLALHVGQHIPHAAGGGVAPTVESCAGRLEQVII